MNKKNNQTTEEKIERIKKIQKEQNLLLFSFAILIILSIIGFVMFLYPSIIKDNELGEEIVMVSKVNIEDLSFLRNYKSSTIQELSLLKKDNPEELKKNYSNIILNISADFSKKTKENNSFIVKDLMSNDIAFVDFSNKIDKKEIIDYMSALKVGENIEFLAEYIVDEKDNVKLRLLKINRRKE